MVMLGGNKLYYINDFEIEKYEKYSEIDYKSKKKLIATIIQNGYILPANKYYNPDNSLFGSGGVVNETGKYLHSSAMLGENMSNRLYGKYKFNKDKVKYINEKVIYLNYFVKHWGHYLIDVIGRLWYILENDITDYKIVYTTSLGQDEKIKGNYLELLKLLGIDESKLLMVNKVTRFKEIIVPEMSIFPGKYYTNEYVKIFDKIVENCNIKSKTESKIYCSRKLLKNANKKEIGEEKIEKAFNDNGYKSVYFEKMSVKEQIEIINNSKEIVAVSGTLPHNLLFARNKPHVVILNKTYKLNMHQFLVNQIADLQVDFIDVHISPQPVLYGKGPFVMKVTKFLKEYFKDNNLYLNEKIDCKLTLREKIWFYIRYFYFNKGKIIHDDMFDRKSLRQIYKATQKIK